MERNWKKIEEFSWREHAFCYYYSRMNSREQKVYEKLADGLLHHASSIWIKRVTPELVGEVYRKLVLDLPILFYQKELKIVWYPLFGRIKVIPQYRFGRQKAEILIEEVWNRVLPLLKRCEGKTALEQEQIIHDWFCSNVVYDNGYDLMLGGPSFEMAGPLLYGCAVCSGISKAAKFLFDLVGIPSLVLEGEILMNRDPDPAKNLHAWNMVEICMPGSEETQRYHLDITFDMTLHSKRYFNMTGPQILAERMIS